MGCVPFYIKVLYSYISEIPITDIEVTRHPENHGFCGVLESKLLTPAFLSVTHYISECNTLHF